MPFSASICGARIDVDLAVGSGSGQGRVSSRTAVTLEVVEEEVELLVV